MSVTGNAFDSSLLRRIFSYVKPYRSLFVAAVILTILLALLGPLRPMITQHILDHELRNRDMQGLMTMSLLMLATLIIQSVLQYFHTWNTNLLGQQVIRDLRNQLMERLLRFRISFFDKTPIGTTVTRSVSDMETVADIFSEGLIIIIGDLLQLTVIITVMFYMDWRLALISLSTIPLLLVATNIFKNKIKQTFNEVRTQVAALNTFVQEHLTGMRTVQVFGREETEYRRFASINQLHRKANNRSVWYYSVFFPVVEILSAVSIGLIVWWGASGVIRGEVTFGSLVSFIMYINLLFRPIRELADKFNTLQMGMVSSERIFRLLDENELAPDKGSHAPTCIRGKIEFRDVWFGYKNNENEEKGPDWVIRGLNLTIEPGESIALVGETGSGKTTIIHLLNRFYEINKGSILLDGVDIRDYRLDVLRRFIGMVQQDVFLFSDTVMNNITLNNPGVGRSEVEQAATALGVDGFIRALPGNYDFVVQERGLALSTGQRQLIAFIRAYAYKPSILILDEATASIDSETEELISRATAEITRGKTSIIIAHRLATVQHADRIFVLEKGKVAETGNHRELLEKEGLYKRLFEIQFKHSGADSVNGAGNRN